jgi:hypothetical protein
VPFLSSIRPLDLFSIFLFLPTDKPLVIALQSVVITSLRLIRLPPRMSGPSASCSLTCTLLHAVHMVKRFSLTTSLCRLYHHNPWADTSTGACQSFMYYLEQPVAFFMQRFPGMTIAVAQFFAHHVFNLLDPDPTKPITRISAHDFGVWARDLPIHLGPDARRDPRIAFGAIQPASSPTSGSPYATTNITNNRHPAPVPLDQMLPYERGRESLESDRASFREKAPPLLSISTQQPPVAIESDAESDEEGTKSRSASGNSGARRRRRAARGKGNGTPTSGNITPVLHTPKDEHLDQLATALQMRARAISKTAEPAPPVPAPVLVPSAPLLKKKKSSKWENIFRRDSGSDAEYVTPGVAAQLAKIEVPPTQAPEPAFDPLVPVPVPRTARAVHVNNIIMSLNPAVPAASSATIASKSSAGSSQSREEARGRKNGRKHDISPSSARRTPSAPNERQWRQNANTDAPPPVPTRPPWYHYVKGRDARQDAPTPTTNPPPPVPEMPVEYRTAQAQIIRQPLAPPRSSSPTTSTYTSTYTSGNRKSATPSIRSISTVTSSTSSNWRSSAWSRYAGSVRSVSTTATSVSSGSSWREAERERPKTNVKGELMCVQLPLLLLCYLVLFTDEEYLCRHGWDSLGTRRAAPTPVPQAKGVCTQVHPSTQAPRPNAQVPCARHAPRYHCRGCGQQTAPPC